MIAVWSAAQIQGTRDYQEDRYGVVENNAIFYRGKRYPFEPGLFPAHYSLYVLADGMGGMGHGEQAASTVVEAFIETFINLGNDALPPMERLRAALDEANQAIARIVAREPDKQGMGATLIALLWDRQDSTLNWLSVGDSLLQRYRDQALTTLNQKHTYQQLAQRHADQGDANRAAELAALGNTLSSAVDGQPIPEVDQPDQPLPVNGGDLIILASDGLETLSDQQVSTTLAEAARAWQSAPGAESSTDALATCRDALFDQLRLAQSPYQDNCTLVLIGWQANLPDQTSDHTQPPPTESRS
ncbi:PP2C family protein-serine/threonine phosphatase [Marinobacter zhejiangensis]|uniref:Serine/threonine protein phosphatase PrpC n=1 Tax=Marinobacter zhejiangensis TaxID=488535 RepID=A0A1I4SFX7_9GAMM|nr:protein phosphatase 2C domain-containing protein [Marinobacter zhejiangensis]SFM63230.1 Serine/threonine protein phosphatase PrpC [Marinobacter zhejiangensis]